MISKLEQKLAGFRITFIAEFSDKLTVLTKLWLDARTTQSLEAVKNLGLKFIALRAQVALLIF